MPKLEQEEISLNPNLGQVWTPSDVALEMVDKLQTFATNDSIILDPAAGPGTFFDAAQRGKLKFQRFDCFEIDGRLTEHMQSKFGEGKIEILKSDFLTSDFIGREYDLTILNPPYIRHELVSETTKKELSQIVAKGTGRSFTKRTNYFGYFLIQSSVVLKPGGVMCAIVYDSLNSTRYGQDLITYLSTIGDFLSREIVTTPFEGRMIDAEIILWQKYSSVKVQPLELQYEIIDKVPAGFCLLSDLATIKRGTSFLKREYFVAKNIGDIPGSIPMISKQPMESGLMARSNSFGLFQTKDFANDNAILQKLKEHNFDEKLDSLKNLPLPVYGNILFNYFIRFNPRHLLNELGLPASDNFYCVTPNVSQLYKVHWVISNSKQYINQLISSSRLQGSGLRKLQLFEYSESAFPDYRKFSDADIRSFNKIADNAISEDWSLEDLIDASSNLLLALGYKIG